VAIVGAGAVGVEFPSIYDHRNEGTLVEVLPRLPDRGRGGLCGAGKHSRSEGTTSGQGRSSPARNGLPAACGSRSREKGGEIEVEKLLVAIGRAPVSDGIGLETVRAVVDRGYVQVDEWCETAEPGVYAIGDVIPTPWLAHVASMEGVMVVERIAGRDVRPVPYDETPNCTYCDPEVASVGLTEARAREAGHDVRVGKFPFVASGRAKIAGHTGGFVKIVAEAGNDEVLGVHNVGYKATELIAEAGAVLRLEGTVEELIRTIHAHPTLAESVHEAAHAVRRNHY
jgi:dihydrolipoamide dehydrogenase